MITFIKKTVMRVFIFHCNNLRSRFLLLPTREVDLTAVPNPCPPHGEWVYFTYIDIENDSPVLWNGLVPAEIIGRLNRDGYAIVDSSIQTTFQEIVLPRG